MANFKVFVVILLLGVLLFGCLNNSQIAAPVAQQPVIGGVPEVSDLDAGDGVLDIANDTLDISEVDISDAELNETLG